MDEWLTSQEATDKYKISRQTLYRWIKSEKVVAKKFGSSLRINKASLDAMLPESSRDIIRTYPIEVFEYKDGNIVASNFPFAEKEGEIDSIDDIFTSLGFYDKYVLLHDDMGRDIFEVRGKENEKFLVLLWLSGTPTLILIKTLIEYISFLRFIQPIIDIQKMNKTPGL